VVDVDAHRRSLVLLASVLDIPVLRAAVLRHASEPPVAATTIEEVPVEKVRPAAAGPLPTFVFFTGAHPLRRREPLVRRVTQGLARAGYQVFLPDLPGLGEGEISPRTLDAALAVTKDIVERDDVAGGRVTLFGASAGASLALLAASDAQLAERVSLVVAVAPFADLEKMLCLATTRSYEDAEGRYDAFEADALLRRVVVRSLVALLPEPDRGALRAELPTLEEEDAGDELDSLRRAGPARTEEAKAVLDLLHNTDAGRFPALCAELPADVVAVLRALSPIHTASRVRAPVEIIVPPRDLYFPPGEALSLARALPEARLTTTPTLEHTRPIASLRRLPELGGFYRFVARCLARAYRSS
jgi:pimeloyl-ACP methyl ester carboxylesterase